MVHRPQDEHEARVPSPGAGHLVCSFITVSIGEACETALLPSDRVRAWDFCLHAYTLLSVCLDCDVQLTFNFTALKRFA